MFASGSLREHLARGIVGVAAFAAAAFCAPLHPWLTLTALAAGLVVLRGCPSCWLVGLVQTIAPQIGKASPCLDGSCAKRPPA